MDKGSVVGFVPVRGGSKGILNKNVVDFHGKPLIYYVLKAAEQASCISKVYVATDSELIRKKVLEIGFSKVKVIGRSKESAQDDAPSEIVLTEFCENFDFEFVFFIQATCPFLKAEHLDEAFKRYRKLQYDSMLSVVKLKKFLWEEKQGFYYPVNYDINNRPLRQNFEKKNIKFKEIMIENGAFYLNSRKNILKSKCRVSGKIGIYEMPDYTLFEIDTPDDLKICKNIYASFYKIFT